ncbi:hypothetical protein SOVF_155920 [Spinacia oleracea]|nr:hypothetical protein SOVF_155920 [Spinacia oleracea]
MAKFYVEVIILKVIIGSILLSNPIESLCSEKLKPCIESIVSFNNNQSQISIIETGFNEGLALQMEANLLDQCCGRFTVETISRDKQCFCSSISSIQEHRLSNNITILLSECSTSDGMLLFYDDDLCQDIQAPSSAPVFPLPSYVLSHTQLSPTSTPTPIPTPPRNKKIIIAIIVPTVTLVVLIALCIGFFSMKRKEKPNVAQSHHQSGKTFK